MNGDFEGRCLGELKAFLHNARVEAFGYVSLRLLEELSNQKHVGSRSVAGDLVLGGSGAGNHGGRWVLDLHLAQQDFAVLGQLDLAGSVDEHLDCSFGAQIGLEHLLQAQGSIDVERQRLASAGNFGLGVCQLYGGRGPGSVGRT